MNVGTNGDDVMSGGKLFHVCATVTWNVRSLTVERCVIGVNSTGVEVIFCYCYFLKVTCYVKFFYFFSFSNLLQLVTVMLL